jgi:hypothetical protein
MKPIAYLSPTMAAALLIGCSSSTDSGGSTTKPPSELNFLTLAPTAPALCSNSVTFDATKGVDVEAALEFPEPGEPRRLLGGNRRLRPAPDR